jgi:hypothetical protein
VLEIHCFDSARCTAAVHRLSFELFFFSRQLIELAAVMDTSSVTFARRQDRFALQSSNQA